MPHISQFFARCGIARCSFGTLRPTNLLKTTERTVARQKGMDVTVLVQHAIAGIEADHDEIRPGLTKALGIMSRVAPNFMMAHITRMSAPKQQKNIELTP